LKTGIILISVGAFLISFSAVFVKLAHISPTMAGFYRMFFGGCTLSVILLLRKENPFFSFGILGIQVICGFFFALDLFLWHRSIHYVGPGLATILANFQVFVMAVYGMVALRERITLGLAFSMPMAILGLFLLAGIGRKDLPSDAHVGIELGLATAAIYACYLIFLQKLQRRPKVPSPMANLAVISLVTAGLLAVTSVAEQVEFTIPDLHTFFYMLGYGILCQVLGWVFITKGLPRIRSSLAGLLLLIQPAFSFIWDILFFQRPTTPVELFGAILAISAIYFGTVSRSSG